MVLSFLQGFWEWLIELIFGLATDIEYGAVYHNDWWKFKPYDSIHQPRCQKLVETTNSAKRKSPVWLRLGVIWSEWQKRYDKKGLTHANKLVDDVFQNILIPFHQQDAPNGLRTCFILGTNDTPYGLNNGAEWKSSNGAKADKFVKAVAEHIRDTSWQGTPYRDLVTVWNIDNEPDDHPGNADNNKIAKGLNRWANTAKQILDRPVCINLVGGHSSNETKYFKTWSTFINDITNQETRNNFINLLDILGIDPYHDYEYQTRDTIETMEKIGKTRWSIPETEGGWYHDKPDFITATKMKEALSIFLRKEPQPEFLLLYQLVDVTGKEDGGFITQDSYPNGNDQWKKDKNGILFRDVLKDELR